MADTVIVTDGGGNPPPEVAPVPETTVETERVVQDAITERNADDNETRVEVAKIEAETAQAAIEASHEEARAWDGLRENLENQLAERDSRITELETRLVAAETALALLTAPLTQPPLSEPGPVIVETPEAVIDPAPAAVEEGPRKRKLRFL